MKIIWDIHYILINVIKQKHPNLIFSHFQCVSVNPMCVLRVSKRDLMNWNYFHLRCCVMGCTILEDYFIEREGLFTLLDLLVVSTIYWKTTCSKILNTHCVIDSCWGVRFQLYVHCCAPCQTILDVRLWCSCNHNLHCYSKDSKCTHTIFPCAKYDSLLWKWKCVIPTTEVVPCSL